ncbi:MAG: hypothetical protein RLY87_1135 [Chloroflexota bacterium]
MKSVRTVLLVCCALAFLVACGGSAAVVPTALAKSDIATPANPALDAIIAGWKTEAKAGLELGAVKPESIVVEEYASDADLNAIAEYYNKQLGTGGWTFRKRTPGLNPDGFFLAGYDYGNQALIIGAVDLTKFGGKGSYVYLAHGTK